MSLIRIVGAALAVLLGGCAATSSLPTDPTASTNPHLSNSATPLTRATITSGQVSQLPGGALQPLAANHAVSQSVAALTPPADLWERIRRGFAMPDLNSDLVRDREQWYASRPDYIARMTERSTKYLFHIVEELERRNMPTELALLPFIESAFNPQAVSSAKAAGMWQFMPATGKHFELKQNAFRDDRRDVLASTRAALDYLQKLYGMFGDWHLALAAYNWGEGNVQRAIDKNQRAGLGVGYLDLNMPAETRLYVPKLQAMKNIVAAPQNFIAVLPVIENHPYFQTVLITRDIDVSLAAKLARVDLEDFKALNPSANRPVILAAGTPQILLPWDNAAVFEANLRAYSGLQLASWTAWRAPSTMKPSDAAKQAGMAEADLRAINRIPAGMLIQAGSTLLIPRLATVQEDVTEVVAENGQLSLSPQPLLARRTVRAGKNESVATIARRYHVKPTLVADWNNVSVSAAFKAGQMLALYVPVSSGRIAPTRTAASTAVTAPTRVLASHAEVGRKPASRAVVATTTSRKVASTKASARKIATPVAKGARPKSKPVQLAKR
ncbi:MAG: transglycosylase SLT domain-containing protein [Burkholderiaceae bacterium]